MGLSLRQSRLVSTNYHSLFNYPLDRKELEKWQAGRDVKLSKSKLISPKEKLRRRANSVRKIKIAKKAARILKRIPMVKMIAITGSLAMHNARPESDIDLMIVTSRRSLWTTRLTVTLILGAAGMKLRHAGDLNEKDKLCLNIWLDEDSLKWPRQNIFTAHEICQIEPLVNVNQTYESFLWTNKWALDYWPQAVKINKPKINESPALFKVPGFVEDLAFWLQYRYMKNKITNETVTRTRALFHPFDWSKAINSSIKPA